VQQIFILAIAIYNLDKLINFSMLTLLLRWLGILLISTILLVTSGCQSIPQQQATVTKITFWHGINPPENREVFQELLDKFNQTHHDIQVEAFYIGQPDQQIPKILTAIVGNQPPDILWYVTQLTSRLVEFDAIRPLEDWLDKSPLKIEIDPAMFASMEFNEHIYSVPFATNNTAIFYRPSLFKEAGIEQLPKTWEEFHRVAKKLTQDLDGDGRIDRHGILLSLGKGEWNIFVWLPFIYSAGGELIEDNRPNLVNSGVVRTLQFGADLVKEGVAILSSPERGYELNDFLTGKVAMQVTGPWTLRQLKQSNADFDVFPIPVLEKPATVIGGENLFVFKTTPKREQAAIEFLEYILSEEFQTAWAIKTGYLPINIRSQKSQEYQKFIQQNPVLTVFLEQMQWARSRPLLLRYTDLSENLGRAIEASLLGTKKPSEALQEAQKRLDLLWSEP
jgi:multiple sugar transport system substrate-binding protein